MIKVAIIGAGSVVFAKNLTGDILSFDEFKNASISYMDIDPDRLDTAVRMGKKVAQAVGANPARVTGTLNRRKAIEGCDFVINTVQIGGFNSTLVDFEIPRKYGLNFTIADTTGPGGLFRALRTYPMLSGLCRDMEDVCPKAWLLNYSNPMSMNMQTIYRTSAIRGVGLCHSVQGTFQQLMGYIGEEHGQVAFLCAGINHMAFYTRLEKDGQDLYPRLFEAMQRPEIYKTNKVRFELMKRLGYFVTESSEHNAEYNPWFIPRGQEVVQRFDVPIDEYLRRCDGIVEEYERTKTFSKTRKPLQVHRSHEYGSLIIHSTVTGTPRVVYGNMPNRGIISNLPPTAIAEAPTLVDRNGCQFAQVGELPPQLIAYMQPHVSQHELFIRAALEGRRDHVYHACMFDPLTAATLTTDQIVEMCDEMIAAHGKALPPLAKKTLVPTSGKRFNPPSPRQLRASWDATQAQADNDAIKDWHVIGPFSSPTPGKVTLDLATPVDADFARAADGRPDLKATYRHEGQVFKWQKAQAARRSGLVNLGQEMGTMEWAVAYGYTEVNSVHPREVELGIGSDDGIRVWLNGKPVHDHEIARGYSAGADKVTVHLRAGVNRILVKIDNYTAGWGFGIRVPQANF